MVDIQKLNVNGTTYDISTTWSKVTGKPDTFPPSSHSHTFWNFGDATLKLYSSNNDHECGSETFNIQSCFDAKDGETHQYAETYSSRCIINLQPRGGFVGIGKATPRHQLDINGSLNATTIYENGSRVLTSLPSHNHDDRYYTESEIDTKLGNKSNTGHTHTISQITNIGSASVNYASSAGSVAWSGISGKPTIFTANGITGNSDCNNIKTNGSYYVSPSSTNKPGDYGEMLCMSNADTHAQIYVPYSNGAMKFRGANDANGYYSWRTVIDDNNISSYALTSLPSHTHSYLPLGGGTLTGLLNITANGITATYGAQNSSWVHFTNSAGINYYFSNSVHVNGDIKVYNKSWGVTIDGRFDGSSFYQSSDERLKTFYDPIEVDLEKLKKLRKNYFKFNDKDKLEIGVSAQEIQQLYPEIVSANDEGYLSVAYDKLSVIALSAIDELHEENKQLKSENDALRKRIEAIENILNKLTISQ